MKKILIGLLATGTIQSFAALVTYDCESLHSINVTPRLELKLNTSFHTFDPSRINGQRVKRASDYTNFFTFEDSVERYQIYEDSLSFMVQTRLNMFYKTERAEKVYMFNYAFPHSQFDPEVSPAYLAIKNNDQYSYYQCKFISTTSWFQ